MIEDRLEVSKEEAISAFINKASVEEYYLNAFNKFDKNGSLDKIQWHWSWWAFGGNIFYLMYRKLYIEAFVVFGLLLVGSFIPPLNILLFIAFGGFLPFLVYKKYIKSCQIIMSHNAKGEEALSALKWVGGYNNWAIIAGIIFNIYGSYLYIQYDKQIQEELLKIEQGYKSIDYKDIK